MKPFISIIIPSFNKVRFIGKTLESIVSQDYQNYEVIVQDGGSTDGTLRIIEKYVSKYPANMRFESKKDKGQWDAINKGFKKAKGKILAYINADDIYKDGALAEIERLYRLNIDALWFAGRGNVIDKNGVEIAKFATAYKNLLLFLNRKSLILILNYLMQPSVFITKKAWTRFGPFTGSRNFVMEYDLWLKIAKFKMPVVTKRYLSSFRIEPGTITKKYSEILLKEDEMIIKRHTDNPLILFLHGLHNIGRLAVSRFV